MLDLACDATGRYGVTTQKLFRHWFLRSIVSWNAYSQTHRLGLSVLSLNSSVAIQLQQYLYGIRDDPLLLGQLSLSGKRKWRNRRSIRPFYVVVAIFTKIDFLRHFLSSLLIPLSSNDFEVSER
jgi:hypothetical protein